MPNRKKLGLLIAIFFAFLGTFSLVAPTFSQFKSLQLSSLFVPNNAVDIAVQETVGETKTIEILPTWDTSVAVGDPVSEIDMWDRSGVWVGGGSFNSGNERWRQRALLNFDLVQIPNQAIIDKVTLKLKVGGTTSGAQDFNMLISRINNPYSNGYEGINWESTQHLEIVGSVNSGPITSQWPPESVNLLDITSLFSPVPLSDITLFLKDINEQAPGGTHNQRAFWSRECNTEGCLKPTLVVEYTEPAKSSPIGYLDGVDSGIVAGGWACDTDTPNTPIEVHLYADKPVGQNGSVFLGNYVAGNDRPDLTGLCGGTTNHGFSISLDQIKQNKAHLMDGNMHPIHVYAINYNSQGNPSDENQNPHLEHSGGVWANRNFVYLDSSKIVDVIKNPSFENDLNWVVSPGELQFSKPYNGKEYSPLFGSKYAKLPSENGRAVKIQQTINIPNNLMHPKLVYFYHMSEPPNPVLGSAECNNGERFSSVEVIANGNGYQGKNYPICKGIGKPGWTKESLDLSALSGKTVNLVISNRTWDNDDTHNFLLDGIYLMADGIVERPDYCSSISLSTNELKEGETLTLTSTAKTNELKSFSFAFFNKDNLTTGENPTPKGIEYVPGEHFATVFVPLPNEPVYTGSTTVAYEDLFKPDTNWSNKIPESIQVNAYFTDGNNNTSQADEACVASFKLMHSAEGCVDLDGDDDCNPDVFDLLALLDVVLEPSTEYDIAFDIKQDSKVDVFDLIEFIDLYITN